jgi:ribonucleoside-diphosphate reductase alpha chain
MAQPTLTATKKQLNNHPTETHHSSIKVIKRSGRKDNLDVTKIRSVVNWACQNMDVNPITLEAGLTTRLRDGVTTREIQENLIRCALEMCSPSEPEWRYVAGRLHTWSLWKDTLAKRGYLYEHYHQMVQAKVDSGEYDPKILNYSQGELQEAGSWLNSDWDTDYDYAGAVLLSSRYLLDNELPQEAFLTASLLIALAETPQTRLAWAKQFYEAIAQRKLSLATPILANLRTQTGSLTSCFITAMDDNLESIFEEVTNTARISKSGGGVVMNCSRIRATGSWVMGKKNASGGVIPWLKILNDTAIAVNQGGRRAGAVTTSIDIWHLDVPEFLEMQTENGDQRRKAYDVFPQLVITDEFMRRVVNSQDWTLIDPYEVKKEFGIELAQLWGEEFDYWYQQIEKNLDTKITLYKRINAKELFKLIMRSQVETGLPYLAFKDTINRANPNQHDGYIPCVNLCTESFSNVKPGDKAHCCNLLSLNLANIEINEIPHLCNLGVRILDNTIEISEPPFTAAKNHNEHYRTIGVGCMGLADWLAKRQLSYTHLQEINHLFEDIGYWCTNSSMELAKERGSYPAFPGSQWSQGKLIGNKPKEWYLENAKDGNRWVKLSEDIQAYGIRNSHITAIAPNTSSSLVQGCTASVLPAYSRFFYDKWAKGTVPIAPQFINDYFWYYQENKSLDQQIVVKAIASIQQWIDTGISMELIFNLNRGIYDPNQPDKAIKAKDIFDTLIMAWELGCKAIYYIRTVQKDDFKESDSQCSSCAN